MNDGAWRPGGERLTVETTPGRNRLCACGSGRKYKLCYLKDAPPPSLQRPHYLATIRQLADLADTPGHTAHHDACAELSRLLQRHTSERRQEGLLELVRARFGHLGAFAQRQSLATLHNLLGGALFDEPRRPMRVRMYKRGLTDGPRFARAMEDAFAEMIHARSGANVSDAYGVEWRV